MAFILAAPICFSREEPEKAAEGEDYISGMIRNMSKTVVFLGKKDPAGKAQYFATGFLIRVQNVFHLVTAKHVVINRQTGKTRDEGLLVFFNSKEGATATLSVKELKKQYGMEWVFHKDKEVDIAVIPLMINPFRDDVRGVPDSFFLTLDDVLEFYDVFFLSCEPGIEFKKKITPVIRNGMVGTINKDNTFYIDAVSFPWNSGSPVFLKPSPIRYRKGSKGISVYGKGDPLGGKFIGMIGETVPYKAVTGSDQTVSRNDGFEGTTGLSRVWAVVFIQEILKSDEFKRQLSRLVGKR